jgi:transposase
MGMILRTGLPLHDLLEEFGKWRTIYCLYDKWNGDGTLEAVLNKQPTTRIDDGAIDSELWCVDGSVVRAHRCASGDRKKGIPSKSNEDRDARTCTIRRDCYRFAWSQLQSDCSGCTS